MFRQLDQRDDDRLTVTLEFDPATGSFQVRYDDHRPAGESLAYTVDPQDARLAFLHPFELRPSSQANDGSVRTPGKWPLGCLWFPETDGTSHPPEWTKQDSCVPAQRDR
jgi:hypothetical protein